MTISFPGDSGLPPGLLAQIERTQSTYESVSAITQHVEPVLANMEFIRTIISNMDSVTDIVARQASAMDTIQRSYEAALRVIPPPETWEALTERVRWFREQELFATDLTVREPAAEHGLLGLLSETAGGTAQVEQAASEVRADPELSEKLRKIVGQVNWSGVGRELPLWVALYVAYRILMHYAELPITENLSVAQTAALDNKFQVLALVVAMAAIIIAVRRRLSRAADGFPGTFCRKH